MRVREWGVGEEEEGCNSHWSAAQERENENEKETHTDTGGENFETLALPSLRPSVIVACGSEQRAGKKDDKDERLA